MEIKLKDQLEESGLQGEDEKNENVSLSVWNFNIDLYLLSLSLQLYERLLQEYIYTWYSQLSYDEDFVQELRQIFRHASLELWSRVSKVQHSPNS